MSEIFLCGGAADATVLSNVFIDEYLKDANDAQLKVYLFLVRRLQAGDPVSISDMADRFNHTEKDILRALCYWEKCGVLTLTGISAPRGFADLSRPCRGRDFWCPAGALSP